MQILNAAAIRAWDEYTIAHEPISSTDLMERAASACVGWLLAHRPSAANYHIFCGKGNNGGDGLAMARLLAEADAANEITVAILEFGHMGTPDFQTNLARLHTLPQVNIRFIQSPEHFYTLPASAIVIDALFGTGLNRALEGVTAQLVEHINQSGCPVLSIDIPSGLFADRSSLGNVAVKAWHTLSFQCMKMAFLLAENAAYIGNVHLLDIGLHPDFYRSVFSPYELVNEKIIRTIYKPRSRFAHKGNFGHGLLVAGSHGKIGAAVLAAQACLRSGVGLLTVQIPACGYAILQATVPEAMVISDAHPDHITAIEEELEKYKAIGVGPGIGKAPATTKMFTQLISVCRQPLVIDADALNILSGDKSLLAKLPANSILTPHPKEFARLFGETNNDLDKLELAIAKARELQVIIVLKGQHTLIATPDGKAFFNNTGNAGMATGGSGDVLTGIITGLLAQGYAATDAAILGVWLHGKAGDIAAAEHSKEAMVPSDIIDSLGKAYQCLAVENVF